MNTIFVALIMMTFSALLIFSMYMRESNRKRQKSTRINFEYSGCYCTIDVRLLRISRLIFTRIHLAPNKLLTLKPPITCKIFQNDRKVLKTPSILGKYNSIGITKKHTALNIIITLDNNILLKYRETL